MFRLKTRYKNNNNNQQHNKLTREDIDRDERKESLLKQHQKEMGEFYRDVIRKNKENK